MWFSTSPPPPPPTIVGTYRGFGTNGAFDSAQDTPPPPSILIHSSGRSFNKHRGPKFLKDSLLQLNLVDEVDVIISYSQLEAEFGELSTAKLGIMASIYRIWYVANDKDHSPDTTRPEPPCSILKMKAVLSDVVLEQLVPDLGSSVLISNARDRRAVRTHMRILSVVRIEVFSMYGYNYMKKIVLRRADLKEYVIAERDFKYMYPSDFEDLYLLNLQGHLNHLSPEDKKILTTAVNLWTRNLVIRQRVEDFQLGIESYQTQLNLTKPRWEATRFEFKLVGLPSQRVQSQQDKSRDEYKILDEERRCQKQGVHVRYPETAKDTTYLPESGKLCWWKDSRRRLPVGPPDNEVMVEMEIPRSSEVNSQPHAQT
ncbi:hypothetical protein Tco_0679611 [Tanacetum coccineum]|uniref:Uncharacterized protein n=1 Tax=Tanacetum coccineum TaxID=301880 RepID=A0ABQ4XIZ9_9ASTR